MSIYISISIFLTIILWWIIVGCFSCICLFILTITIGSGSMHEKIEVGDIKSVFIMLSTGVIGFILIIILTIKEYLNSRRQLKKTREETEWWKLKQFGGWV